MQKKTDTFSGKTAGKIYFIAKEAQTNLCNFAVAPPTGSVD